MGDVTRMPGPKPGGKELVMKRPFRADLKRAEGLIKEAKVKLQEAMPLVTQDIADRIETLISDFHDIETSVMSDQEDIGWDVAEGEEIA